MLLSAWGEGMNYWSRDYVASVAAFQLAIEKIGQKGLAVTSERLLIGQIGPNDEDLAIEIAIIGDKKASKWFLQTSGVHGVEGFAGSAIQISILDQIESVPQDTALVFIHIVNPFGMAWMRRVNESNVDLNRNMLLPDEEYSGEPEGYAELSPIINQQEEPKLRDGFLRRALWHVAKNGFANTKQAYAMGQYERPLELQFGGAKMERSLELFLAWFGENSGYLQRCVWVDLHTGLGKSGIDSLLVDSAAGSPKFIQLRECYGKRVFSLDPKAGVAYKIRGGFQAGIEARFPDIEWTSITQEFGTHGPFTVISALRHENMWTHWGGASGRDALNHWSRNRLRDAFRVNKPKWEYDLIKRGRALFATALADLARSGD